MAHYAFLDDNNIVTEVIVGRDEWEVVDGISDWEEAYSLVRGQKCKRTSYNGNIRGVYAGVGMTYDETNDVFVPPVFFREDQFLKTFIGLGGLPRSGSTLLGSILYQNPLIHTEGNSALCQIMWDVQQSCFLSEQLQASCRTDVANTILRSIPVNYYSNTERPVIVDKCRSWCLPANMDLIKRYITSEPKIIVMTRGVEDILESFKSLFEANNRPYDESEFIEPYSEPLMRSLEGVQYAEENNKGEFLFVSYDDLLNDANTELNRIYEFLCLEPFQHDLNNIVTMNPENDLIYGLDGMHHVRSKIGRRDEIQSLVDICASSNLGVVCTASQR